MKLYAPSTIRDIKERHGFKLSKSLGQNFLTDKNTILLIGRFTPIPIASVVIRILVSLFIKSSYCFLLTSGGRSP